MHKLRECPNCSSEDVKPEVSEMTSYSHGNSSTWICNSCGNRGIFPTTENREENDEERETGRPLITVSKLKALGIITAFLILLLALTVHLN